MDQEFSSVLQYLKIPRDYCTYREAEQCVDVVVHQHWIRSLLKSAKVPDSLFHDTLSNAEVQAALSLSPDALPGDWIRLFIQIYPKKTVDVYDLIGPQQNSGNLACNASTCPCRSLGGSSHVTPSLSYSQLLHCVAQNNVAHLLEDTLTKHKSHKVTVVQQHFGTARTIPYNEGFLDVCCRLYSCPIIRLRDNGNGEFIDSSHRLCPLNSLLSAYCVLDCEDCFMVLLPAANYSLQHCVTFSPQKLSSDSPASYFLLQQLLELVRQSHSRQLLLGDVALSHLHLDDSLALSIRPDVGASLLLAPRPLPQDKKPAKVGGRVSGYLSLLSDPQAVRVLTKADSSDSENESASRNLMSSIVYLTQLWCHKRLCNFDYLLCLAYFAGREFGSPKYHPTLPWVIDFAHSDLPLRDLTRSKFRLTKGDQQLDQTYLMGALSDTKQVTPHHITESFSELTFYLYFARVTTKPVLQAAVRQQWVPGHYPASIMRLYETTPDECIPEFYTNTSIFKSIHDDLGDLLIPPHYGGDCEAFLTHHRKVLESEAVTAHLHHWIDLTYGYKLSGAAAVKSKNVLLELVGDRRALRRGGMCQLFAVPHPPVLSNSPATLKSYLLSNNIINMEAQNKKRNRCSMPDEPTGSPINRAKNNDPYVSLPKGYNPVSDLNHLEMLYSFVLKTTGRLPCTSFDSPSSACSLSPDESVRQRKVRDMQAIACVMVEMFASQKCRILSPKAPLEQRYSLCCSLVRQKFSDIPRTLRPLLRILFQVDELSSNSLPSGFFSPISSSGLPPPSPSLLLEPLVNMLPFPSSYQDLHSFICQIRHLMDSSARLCLLSSNQSEKEQILAKFGDLQLRFVAHHLSNFLSSDCLSIILPIILKLFVSPHTAVSAAYYLTCPLAQALGPVGARKHLLPPLLKLYESDILSEKHLKLFHRSFLMHIIVWFGLETFLSNFVIPLIEGVGGYKELSGGGLDTPDGSSRKQSTTLRNVELGSLTSLHQSECGDNTHDCSESPPAISKAEQSPSQLLNNSDALSVCSNTPIDKECDEVFVFESTEDMEANSSQLSQGFRSAGASDSGSFEDLPLQEDHSASGYGEDETDTDTATPGGRDASSSPSLAGLPVSSTIVDIPVSAIRGTSFVVVSNSLPNFNDMDRNCSDLPSREESFAPLRQEENVPVEEIPSSDCGRKAYTRQGDESSASLSEICSESVLWLSHRLGPVLTAKYLTRNLLKMLTLCYMPENGTLAPAAPHPVFDKLSVTRKRVQGDISSRRVLECLSEVSLLYGEQVALFQYVGHIVELISAASRHKSLQASKSKLSSTTEAGLLGAMALLQHLLPLLSDTAFMNSLQKRLIEGAVYPVIRLLTSTKVTFPHGAPVRAALSYRVVDILFVMALRVGREMSKRILKRSILRLLGAFDKVYTTSSHTPSQSFNANQESQMDSPTEVKTKALQELKDVLTPEFAYLSYYPFIRFMGCKTIDSSLSNPELLRSLCIQFDDNLQNSEACHLTRIGNKIPTLQRMSSEIWQEATSSPPEESSAVVSGNRIVISTSSSDTAELPAITSFGFQDAIDISAALQKPPSKEESKRHLRENWLAYWEHEIGRSQQDSSFNLNLINLMSFMGHSSGIKGMLVLDNENSFISCSKDKTVKLWSLRSEGGGSAQCCPQWTYFGHKKSVFSVTFSDRERVVASCDSSVHVWDPFIGSPVRQFDALKHCSVTVLASMRAPSSHILAATTDATLRVLDLRVKDYTHQYKVCDGGAGLIRNVECGGEHLVCVAHSSGVIAVIDTRTGALLSTSKHHEGEVLSVRWYKEATFISSALDQTIAVWNAGDGVSKFVLKGFTEPIRLLQLYQDQLLSVSTGNRLGHHLGISPSASYSSSRLRSDTIRGAITAMELLPLNRMILIASDTGAIRLLS